MKNVLYGMMIGSMLLLGAEGRMEVSDPILYPAGGEGNPEVQTPLVPQATELGGQQRRSEERIVPHRVETYDSSGTGGGYSTAVENKTQVSSQKEVRQKKQVSVFQRYMHLIRTKLSLSGQQKKSIRKILRRQKQSWKQISGIFRKLNQQRTPLPPMTLFMRDGHFNVGDFRGVITARNLQKNFWRREKEKRYILWMAVTLKKVIDVLTPEQKRTLIRLTGRREEGMIHPAYTSVK